VDVTGPPLQALLDAIANGPSGLGLPSATSNALLIAGEHTRNGNPIAVFGPQTAYFMPQLLQLLQPERLTRERTRKAATRWIRLNYLRGAVAFIAWLAALRALSVSN